MKIGRNDPCHCGSGKKYKKCCLAEDERLRSEALAEEAAEITASSSDTESGPAEGPPPKRSKSGGVRPSAGPVKSKTPNRRKV